MTYKPLIYLASALALALMQAPAVTAQDSAATSRDDGEARAYRQAMDDCAKHASAARDACNKEAMDKFAKPMGARMPGSVVGNPPSGPKAAPVPAGSTTR